ncbi:MAG: O-antigen ligase family protein, partial [Actinomycetota bacterium]|nr:O-antigen ligase family protein [Actinomycetota bacterium]
PDAQPTMHSSTKELSLRTPRALYYIGMLLLCQLTFRPFGGATLSDWFFLASMVATVTVLLANRRSPTTSLPPKLLLGVLVFVCGGALSSLGADSPLGSMAVMIRFVYVTVIWFWLGAAVLQTPSHVRTAQACWVVSATATGAAAIAQLAFGDVIPNTTIAFGRMTGFTQHVNDLGGLSAIALVPAIMFATGHGSTSARRVLVYVPVIIIGIGLLLSGSIGGVLAACAGLGIWVVFGKGRNRLLVLLLIAAVGLVLVVKYQQNAGGLSPRASLTRVTGGAADSEGTLHIRLETLRAAWKSLVHNPVIGVGLDEKSSTLPSTGLQVHNMFIGPWFEAGIMGLIGMLLTVGVLLRLGRASVSESRTDRMLALSLYCALIAFLVFGMGAPVLYQRYGWASAALVVALHARLRPAGPSHDLLARARP